MFKKILRMAMTFVVLTAAYSGYSRGFALLAGRVAPVRNVPILPTTAVRSRSSQEATDLAIAAFGPGHWAVNAPMRYYDINRGYWIFWREQVRLDDGKNWEFSPVAIITKSKNSKELKTISGDRARVEFNRPFDVSKPGEEPAHVVHANIRDNVLVRADKGTPDLADDFATEAFKSLEYDEAKEQIVSLSDERVVLHQGDMTATGVGLMMQLRHKDPGDPSAPAPKPGATPGFDGVKSISFLRDVEIDVQDVGQSGIVPGGKPAPAKVVVAATKDGKTTTKTEPRPGHIQCAGKMTIDLPKPRRRPHVGPPAPADPTYATFHKNVRVRQGDVLKPEQLDCDDLLATMLPAEKIVPAKTGKSADGTALAAEKSAPRGSGATARDQTKIDDDDPATPPNGSATFSNLALHRAHATGHAVWLQSESEGMRGFGNELIYDRLLPESPDKIYFRGDKSTEVVKTDFDAAGKPQTVNTIISKDFTVFQYGPGGPAPAVVANGPGTLEARAAGKEAVERFASWSDKLVMQSVTGSENRVITLYGHPRVRDVAKSQDITADEWLVAEMEPKKKPDGDAASVKVVQVDGRDVSDADTTGTSTASASSTDPKSPAKSGDGMRLKAVRALGNVRLVTEAMPADPKAKPPRAASARKDLTARHYLKADFAEAPAPVDPPKPKAKAPEVASNVPIIERPELTARAEPPRAEEMPAADDAPKPAPRPAEPAMVAIADDVWALVLQQPGSDKSQVQEARLTGAVEIHQDPADGKTQGSDLTGKVVYLKNKGENRSWIQAQGTPDEPAVAITQDRAIAGPILTLDQANDHAWVKGAGRLETQQGETDLFDDTAPEVIATGYDGGSTSDKPNAKAKVRKGPLIITWGASPDDKTAWMHFYGKSVEPNGEPGPAKAHFFSHVRGNTDDSSVACEDMEATFDGPISFVKPKKDAAEARSKGEKEPGPQIVLLHCKTDVEIISRKIDPETGYLKDKKRILHKEVTYVKPTGRFYTAKGPGQVYLYNAKDRDKADDKAPLAATSANRLAVKPVTTRVSGGVASKAKGEPPQLTLTHIRFQRQMFGRFAPPKDAKPGEYSEAEFFGSVEALSAKVPDESAELNPDRPPDDFYRLVSERMHVQIEPPPDKTDKKAKDRVLLDAYGGKFAGGRPVYAFTSQKSIEGDRITYDSMSELSYVYGYGAGVSITNTDGPGQGFSATRGSAVVHNHKTGFSQLIDPQSFVIIDPRTDNTNRSALIPFALPPIGSRDVPAMEGPSKKKLRNPLDPVFRAKQLRIPPRSDKERRGFYGR